MTKLQIQAVIFGIYICNFITRMLFKGTYGSILTFHSPFLPIVTRFPSSSYNCLTSYNLRPQAHSLHILQHSGHLNWHEYFLLTFTNFFFAKCSDDIPVFFFSLSLSVCLHLRFVNSSIKRIWVWIWICLTCAQKWSEVGLVYRTMPETKKSNERKTKSLTF